MATSLSSKTTSNPDINPPNKCKVALSIQILPQTDVTCSINRCMAQKDIAQARCKVQSDASSKFHKCCFSKWTDMVDCMPHSWPKSFNIGRMQIVPIHAASFHKHRKFTRARHMWLRLEPNWRLLRSHMYTEWPGIHTYAEINDRLFVNPGRNDNIQDAKSKVRRYSPEYWQWMGQIEYMWQFLDG